MEILLANPRGFCAGVDRAIIIVEQALEKFGAPIYVRHEVVHNKFVVDHVVEVKAPLNLGHQEARRVVVAEIKAHPLLAYGKTYSKLLDYCKAHDMKLKLPTVEILEHSVLRVEMPLDEAK